MTLALEFQTPWLLLGLAAAAIPLVLHLLSSVRAPEVHFPTLRFLKLSMEKTARRRRLEHWLLLLLRTVLLAALAFAVAEPIVKAARGFWADSRVAAVLVVDNSYSMQARSGGSTRFKTAQREADRLLGPPARCSLAEVLLTNAPSGEPALRADLEPLRERLTRARPVAGKAAVAQRVVEAVKLLQKESAPQKAVYVFSDMQRESFEELAGSPEVKESGIPLMLVDCSAGEPVNVGIADLRISGYRVVDKPLELSATLVNSSPTNKVASVWLQIDGRPTGEPVRVALEKVGSQGSRATVKFRHTFTAPGTHVGQVAIDEADDLDLDNIRRFSLDVAGKINAVLVRGERTGASGMDPGGTLQLALDPNFGTDIPWSVRLKTLLADQFAEADLAEAQAAFFADVPSFTAAQATAIAKFVQNDGTAVFFLGPAVEAGNYNQRFVQAVKEHGGLLPGRLDKPVGSIGLTAGAVNARLNLNHPYLQGIYPSTSDYPLVQVQRRYRLAGSPAGLESVLSTPEGEPVVACKSFGQGRVVLFATTASQEWNDLGSTPLLLPMVDRICLEAGERHGGDNTYPVGAAVTIRPRLAPQGKSAVNVVSPDGTVDLLPLESTPSGPAVVFAKTDQIGTYQWNVAGAALNAEDARGAFATNPDGPESDLATLDPADVERRLAPTGVYYGHSLDEVNQSAANAAAGDNWWDRLLAVVILLLVIEALVANRFRRGAEPMPVPPPAGSRPWLGRATT